MYNQPCTASKRVEEESRRKPRRAVLGGMDVGDVADIADVAGARDAGASCIGRQDGCNVDGRSWWIYLTRISGPRRT
ncbi:hypothetical protein predicted by Glimmer/Critica [Sorangium cellulosum So ce56]|uniref:Uncharacterized protein n=1 Tax=Sorangium cellulosum (strain So ce56) TaxID=448385 RepID=A9FIX0_SORC5|nr:hypothetical protein predicted by Glimmer/Critica [Sorangium cellulosum So ce56]